MTLTQPTTPEGRKWLSNVLNGLTHDNTYIVERPGAKEIISSVLPAVRKSYRTTKLPTTLDQIEKQFERKVMWPRSVYKYAVFKDNIKPYTEISDSDTKYQLLVDSFDHCWRPSTQHNFDRGISRNKRALKKAAGLPIGGKKGERLDGAIQYNNNVVKPSNSISKCWGIIPGYRTQQSERGAEKVRLVWAIPVHIWQMECEAFDDCITKSASESVKLTHTIQLFYFNGRADLGKWMSKFQSEVVTWVYVDATQYDSSVRRSEIDAAWRTFAPNYEFINLLSEYASTAEIVMPEGVIARNGGMPSGSKGTNIGDGYCNVGDVLEVLDRMKLLRYVICILVNGDDITVGFSTKFSDKNMDKWSILTRRKISPEKSLLLDDAIWNSKWYSNGEIITRPIFRAINSLLFKERESSALTANAVYTAIARHQILLDVEQHPCYEALASSLAKYEEMSWSKAKSDPRFQETLEYWISSHDYLGDSTPEDISQEIEASRYAKEFAP